jgi:hypothetical protein
MKPVFGAKEERRGLMAMKRGRAAGREARDEAAARGIRDRIDGFTAEKEAVFLLELERSGCVTDAARVVAISTNTINRHRRFRPAFDAACKAARVKARGPLEAVAYLRAVEGTETTIIRGGKVVEVRRKPSDAMLKTLLAAADPEKYGNRPRATAEQLEAIRRGMEEAKVEHDAEAHKAVVERLVRKMYAVKRRMVRAEGYGLTVEGDLVPPGYGPVSAEASPLLANPEDVLWPEHWNAFIERADAERAARRSRGL